MAAYRHLLMMSWNSPNPSCNIVWPSPLRPARRRPGQGETFWQYRNYQPSDSANQIDWRRSARGDQVYIRENEWEAANTVYFWRDGSDGMDWSSSKKLPTKRNRATVLCMAMTSLLIRAGERCAVMGESERARSGRVGQERIARTLARSEGPTRNLDADIPAFARLVIASDFLEPPELWRERLARLSGRPAKGILLHIIDPAEREFPFKGRVQLRIPGLSLQDVVTEEETPDSTPIWLLLFRILMGAIIAIALARPILQQADGITTRPLTLVIDDSWDAAPNWSNVIREAEAKISDARRKNVDVLLLTTTNPSSDLKFVPAEDAMRGIKSLRPQALPPQRDKAKPPLKLHGLIPLQISLFCSRAKRARPLTGLNLFGTA